MMQERKEEEGNRARRIKSLWPSRSSLEISRLNLRNLELFDE